MNYKKLDAIIVGAGVTGSYLSYKLREHGLKVLMVEKAGGSEDDFVQNLLEENWWTMVASI